MSVAKEDLMWMTEKFSEFCPKTLLFKTEGHDYCPAYGTQVREYHFYSLILQLCINKNTFRWLYLATLNAWVFVSLLVFTTWYYQNKFILKS